MNTFRKLSDRRKSRRQSEIADNATQQKLAAVEETAAQSKITQPNTQVKAPTSTQPSTQDVKVPEKGTIRSSLQKTSLLSRTTDNYNPLGNVKPPPREEDNGSHLTTRQEVETMFEQFASMIHASARPLPTQTGDGSYLKRDEPTGLLADLKNLGLKDLSTVRRILEQKASGQPQDDRQYLMEAVMQLVAALPDRSKNRVELTSSFIDELWNSLQHPPLSYLGDDFKYRSADGSRNNYTLPMLGAANTPYARSVNPVTMTPGAKPDPFLLFDSLMARQEFKENPNRVSSVFFNWASLVIHDLFQTDHKNPNISKTSSYLDLSILYGDTQDDQDLMRTFKDGKIKPDCFAEERLLAFPPTAGVLLIMLNRWHNYVVEQLALINENDRFTKPADHLPEDRKKAAWKKYDEDLFQTGRLVTCGLYINITLYDYLRTIVNLNRTNSTWTVDPRLEKPKNSASDGTARGVGNQVSAEFALCYRWHSCVGQLDEAWTEQVYQELFGKSPDQVDMKELMVGLAKYDHELPDDPLERPFAHLKRGPDGKFNDDDLATIMVNGIEQVSGAFGARNTPKSLRAISVLGILQARSWNLCTFNEFRQFFGLKKFDTFEEINSDPYIADQLKNLYEHPDYVELYPGIAIEEAKVPMVPGVGICPNHTIARAVLSDAVALVRGDRFYTIDHSPKNLTHWGFQESAYDLGINQGCVLYKLLLRGLPNHFKPDSIYVHYPMTVPDENAKIMKDLGRFHDYNWEKPASTAQYVSLTGHSDAATAISKPRDPATLWNDHLKTTLLAIPSQPAAPKLLHKASWLEHVKQFYEYVTLKLIAEKAVTIATINQVDIVRDVSNLANVHFIADLFMLPLKTKEDPRGILTDHEFWMATSAMFAAAFADSDPTKSFPLQFLARKLSSMTGKVIEAVADSIASPSFATRVFGTQHMDALAEDGKYLIQQLLKTGMSSHDVSFTQILPAVINLISNVSRLFAEILDFYLGHGCAHWAAIQELAETSSDETDRKLLRYIHEAIRLNGTLEVHRTAAFDHVVKESGKQIRVKAGDKVFRNAISTSRDPSVFPEPTEVKLDRPTDKYIHYHAEDTILGEKVAWTALTTMLRVVARLPGLRRAPGEQGRLKKISRSNGLPPYMSERHDSYMVSPTTMKVHFDGFIPNIPSPLASSS